MKVKVAQLLDRSRRGNAHQTKIRLGIIWHRALHRAVIEVAQADNSNLSQWTAAQALRDKRVQALAEKYATIGEETK